jgi:hypothetical protein
MLRAVAPIGKQQSNPVHPSFLTDGAGRDIDPADPEQLLLPCLLPGVWLGWGFNVS